MVPWACLSYRTDAPLSWDILSHPIFLEIFLPPLILVILLTYVNNTDTVSSELPQNYLPDCVPASTILCCVSFTHSPSPQDWEFLEDGNFVLLIFFMYSPPQPTCIEHLFWEIWSWGHDGWSVIPLLLCRPLACAHIIYLIVGIFSGRKKPHLSVCTITSTLKTLNRGSV